MARFRWMWVRGLSYGRASLPLVRPRFGRDTVGAGNHCERSIWALPQVSEPVWSRTEASRVSPPHFAEPSLSVLQGGVNRGQRTLKMLVDQ